MTMSWFAPKSEADVPAEGRRFDAQLVGPLGNDFQSGALESALHWQVIWPRAIALAWSNDEFRRRLIDDPHAAIEAEFGYVLSKNLELTIEEADAGAFNAAATVEGQDDPWKGLPNLRLILPLPKAPEDPAVQAVAITAYQDTGRTYPFTCC
jgi:ribosomally synthesized peptide (two-chain TOMM family)